MKDFEVIVEKELNPTYKYISSLKRASDGLVFSEGELVFVRGFEHLNTRLCGFREDGSVVVDVIPFDIRLDSIKKR